ncbi:MAG: S1C family serine protease [Rubrobacteraceae bacterium]
MKHRADDSKEIGVASEEMKNEATESVLERLSVEMADAVEAASASVVTVSGGRRFPGSGTVYAAGLVLTSLHAAGDGEGLHVIDAAGRTFEAVLSGYDHRSGLALLKAEGLDAQAAKPAEGNVRVGQFVLSVGRSGGEIRAGFGIVGSLSGGHHRGGWRGGNRHGRDQRGRGQRGRAQEPGHLRLDIAPYFGLGGGAVVSSGGDLAGVVVSGNRGSTFAVPARAAWEITAKIESGGSLRRGYLGVYSQPVRLPDPGGLGLTQEGGLLVAGVSDSSPASEAGVMVGDIIATLDGQPVRDTDDLLTLLQGERVGKTVPIKLIRGGVLTELSVTVQERTPGGGCSPGR